MLEFTQTPVFHVYVVAAAAVTLNLMFLAVATAVTRSGANQMLNPEDGRLNAQGQVVAGDNDVSSRMQRAHRNALENIPAFLIMGLVYVLAGPSLPVAAGLMGTFAVFRWVHSVVYLRSLQPWRTIAFALSFFALLGLVVHTLVLVVGQALA